MYLLYGYGTRVFYTSEFSNDFNQINTYIDDMYNKVYTEDGTTNTTAALRVGNLKLNTAPESENNYLIIFTDGEPNTTDNENIEKKYPPKFKLDPTTGLQLRVLEDEYLDELNHECKNMWESINHKKLAICYGNGIIFKKIFGESGTLVQITEANNLFSSFTNSITEFIETETTTTTITNPNYSYAADSQERRLDVMNYSSTIDYNKACILNQKENIQEFIDNTYMIASTNYFNVSSGENVQNINLALEERPKNSVEITKKVNKLTITLSDGSTLMEYHSGDKNVKNLMILPNSLNAIMDDEITHGATINIQYSITIKNTSELDNLKNYFSKEFYNNNKNSAIFASSDNELESIIKSSYYIYDYMDNNLLFDTSSNNEWNVVENYLPLDNNINTNLQTILEVQNLKNIYLSPNEQSEPLILNTSKILTITDTSLLTYNNFVEIVQYSNILGRRMYDNIRNTYDITPGNFNIYDDERIFEADESKAETVTRVPPFGKNLSFSKTILGIIIFGIEILILINLKNKLKHI